MQIEPATEADFLAVYGERPKFTAQAHALRQDGTAVAIAGVYQSAGRAVAFLQINGPVSAKAIVRLVRVSMDKFVRTRRVPVYAIRDSGLPTSAGLLRHFGFQPVTADGEVYQWAE